MHVPSRRPTRYRTGLDSVVAGVPARVVRPLGAFADVEPWLGIIGTSDEVFLWRAQLGNVQVRGPEDLLWLVKPIGRLIADVKGVAAARPGPSTWVDVVLTKPRIAAVWNDADDVAKAVLGDPDVRALWPNLIVSEPQLLELVAPEDAVDHWLARPALWNIRGATQAWSKPDPYATVQGKADDGPRAVPWEVAFPEPGSGGSVVKPRGGKSSTSGSSAPLLFGLLALGVGYWLWPTKKGRPTR